MTTSKTAQDRAPHYRWVNHLKKVTLNERNVEVIKQVNRHRFLTSEHNGSA